MDGAFGRLAQVLGNKSFAILLFKSFKNQLMHQLWHRDVFSRRKFRELAETLGMSLQFGLKRLIFGFSHFIFKLFESGLFLVAFAHGLSLNSFENFLWNLFGNILFGFFRLPETGVFLRHFPPRRTGLLPMNHSVLILSRAVTPTVFGKIEKPLIIDFRQILSVFCAKLHSDILIIYLTEIVVKHFLVANWVNVVKLFDVD